MKPPDINKYNLKSAVNAFASLSQKYKNIWKTEDAIIFHHIPARDIVSYSNCRFGKRSQKFCLIDIVISSFFPMPESN